MPTDTTPTPRLLVLHATDNVGVARVDLVPGTALTVDADTTVVATAHIGAGHKIALRPIPRGGVVLKYGQVIGVARDAILAGDHVHVHNVEMGESTLAHGVGR